MKVEVREVADKLVAVDPDTNEPIPGQKGIKFTTYPDGRVQFEIVVEADGVNVIDSRKVRTGGR